MDPQDLDKAYTQFQQSDFFKKLDQPGSPGGAPGDSIDLDSAFADFAATKAAPDFQRAYIEKNTGKFQRSLDGDTVDLTHGSKIRIPTRFAGIDAPELGQGALGVAAQKHLENLVAEHGELGSGYRTVDPYGRDVSVLYAGDKNLNVEMVRAGYAKVYDGFVENLSKPLQEELKAAQKYAQDAKIGIWDDQAGFEDPSEWRKKQGAEGSFMGHKVGEFKDPDSVSMHQAYMQFKGLQPGNGQHVTDYSRSAQTIDSPRIKSSDRYVKEEGWLDRVFGALDYAGNVSRSGIKGLVEDGLSGAAEYAGQAARKERHTSSTNLKDTLTEAVGVGKVRMGEDDGKFSVGDVGDFAADLMLDIFTDPISLVSMGLSSVVKGGKLAKPLSKAHIGASEAKAGLNTAAAASWLKKEAGVRAAIGASYGLGASDGDDLGDRLLAAGAGALGGLITPKAIVSGSDTAKSLFNKTSDKYVTYTKGSGFKNYSEARKLAYDSYDKIKNIGNAISQGRFKALEGLDEAGKIRASQVMETMKTEFLRRRKKLENDSPVLKKLKPGSDAYKQVFNNINRAVIKDMNDHYVKGILDKEKDDIVRSIASWAAHNDNVVKDLNRKIYGLERGYAIKGKGIVGIPWHIDDIYKKTDFKEVEEQVLKQAQIYKAESLKRSSAPWEVAIKQYEKQTGQTISREQAESLVGKNELFTKAAAEARDITYDIYAQGFAKNFLDKQEQEALNFMRELAETPARGGWKYVEKGLDTFDKITNFQKANMLYFSLSWLKNNFSDNLAKAYMETGLQGIVDSGTMGKYMKGVYDDVNDLYSNKVRGVYKAEDTAEALDRGVLDNPMFKSMQDTTSRDFQFTPKEISKATGKSPTAFIKRRADQWLNNPYIKAVGKLGSNMEGTARFATYIRTRDALLRSPAIKALGKEGEEKAKDIAADIVKKTFFDYGDVTHFEKAVFQRFIPFYSFYSKNMPYWIEAATNPIKAGRMLAVEKVRRNIGEDPTAYDKSGLSPYLISGGARKLGRDGDKTVYGIAQSGSMYDAFAQINPLEWSSQVVDKGHPTLKTIYELFSGHDLFDDSRLYPSESPQGKKFLFSRGFKHKAIGTPGVDVDDSGNPYATSDAAVMADKIVSTVFPHGLVDQIAGSVGKVSVGKESPLEALMNRISPMQRVKVSDAYGRMIRTQKRGEQ